VPRALRACSSDLWLCWDRTQCAGSPALGRALDCKRTGRRGRLRPDDRIMGSARPDALAAAAVAFGATSTSAHYSRQTLSSRAHRRSGENTSRCLATMMLTMPLRSYVGSSPTLHSRLTGDQRGDSSSAQSSDNELCVEIFYIGVNGYLGTVLTMRQQW